MYVEDIKLRPPQDRDACVWRFLDFPKFTSMLVTPILHFSSVAGLDDPYEGMHGVSPAGTDSTPWFGLPFSEVGSGGGLICRGPEPDEEQIVQAVTELRKRTFTNCWHMNPNEPASMWAQYVPGGAGVAIRSTVGRLIDAFEKCPHEVRLSEVMYIDHETESLIGAYPLARFIRKRKSFEHERELRAIIDFDPHVGWREVSAVSVRIDLPQFITEVRVSPGAPRWFGELVVSLARTFGVSWPTRRSTLDDCPLY
jgi:hypothetical protein